MPDFIDEFEFDMTKLKVPEKEPMWARLPPLSEIHVLQAQFFDNSARTVRKKGEADYAIKLMVHLRGWGVELPNPDWWRVVQLLDPKTVVAWARAKEGMSAEDLDAYEAVYAKAVAVQAEEGVVLVRMGHISSPPGKQYFEGQFVLFILREDEKATLVVYRNGEGEIFEDWKPSRSRGKTVKPGTPKLVMLHDPGKILPKQQEAKKKLAEARGGQP
ncbi:hypothetical protein [Methylobacterium aquaticum]|uniref:Uncharacterized protein n=1 Tax=Methylobacterium aquaticum TaxID=270351 RepID=A0A0J6SW64_9HYPH|nr:hypothetical protein [Methylobacterium aquaticum]KMO37578.1 hypothetical protein VP06_07870 [Methylobacterium aquaticum]